ncbi:MAG TPA: hypothetical protein VGQ80_06370 [Acidimicrobiia bacterium]|nr:hypothetical protein [Acidimicrobiia bacterium]
MSEAGVSLYEAAGGMEFFERLVGDFYRGVEGDDVLAPLYPEAPDFRDALLRYFQSASEQMVNTSGGTP